MSTTPEELIDRMEQVLRRHPPVGVSGDDVGRIIERHRKALVETARELLAVREIRIGGRAYNEFLATEVETWEMDVARELTDPSDDPQRAAFVAAMRAAKPAGKAMILRMNANAIRYLGRAAVDSVGPEGTLTDRVSGGFSDEEERADVRATMKEIREVAAVAGVPVAR